MEEADGVRGRARRAVRAELAELALGLFVERGFDTTTVDDVARVAGLSKRSLFRYFATKEDMVLGVVDVMGEGFAEEVRARPAEETPWDCLRAVLHAWEARIRESTDQLARLRLIESTPTLRARLHQRRDESRRLIADALRERPGSGLDGFTAEFYTAAAGAALDAASSEWLRTGGATDRATLIDRAFTTLRPS
ncbi:TetR family transcriptional regulator [Streptosporangium soli]|nr:TetR/AcrR family transcriptional regulator [Streptosporangium sp. KLBMP 9127]